MRHLIYGVSVFLAVLLLSSIFYCICIMPADNPSSPPAVSNGDLFYDFTKPVQHDESSFDWQGYKASLTMNHGAHCASDGRMLAYGTLALTSAGSTQNINMLTSGLQYTGNKDDIYAEIRLKADGFDGSKSGTIMIYPRNADSSDVCLTATFSEADLTAGDYVTLRFTNVSQFTRWQSLDAIHNIAVEFRYDGLEASHSLTYDYIYIGSVRQNHVMMDFSADSPANSASHWTVRSALHSCHNTTAVSAKDGCLYGTTSLEDPAHGYSIITTENQFLYTVQSGDIVKLRVKLSHNAAKGGTLQEMRIGMGVGGTGYWAGYKGTILNIPKLQIDGLYHEYTIKITENSNIVGKPLRSFCYGFVGRGGYTLDWEIDYIYVGSEINFSAYTGRSTIVETPTPADDDVQTIDNSLISLRLFNYNARVNDNTSAGVTLNSCFPFHNESKNDSSFYEASNSTVMPYLSQDGYPMLNNGANLGCLFGKADAVGVHSYSPINSVLSFDGETYSYDSTKHAVDYDTATGLFYIRSKAGDGFTPFSYGKEIDNWFGFTMEMNFVQSNKEATLKLSCIDDAWVFIDGVLVLDLGGSEICKTGSIQFGNGEIIAAATGKSQKHSLLQRYQAAGRQAATSWDGTTFAEGSVHSLKIFFLERSTTGTQCQLSFNLSPVASTDRHEFIPLPCNIQIPVNRLKNDRYTMQLWDKQETNSKYNDDHSFRLNYEIQSNGHSYPMGNTAKYSDNAPITAFVELFDPAREVIGTVHLMGANGVSVFSRDIHDSYAYLEIPLTAEQPYYYVSVISANRQHSITLPIWLEKCSSHFPTVDAAVSPTCATDGKTEGSHCTACYAILAPQAVIPATGHSLTYANNGAAHRISCKRCEYNTEEPHSFTNAVCICGAMEVTAPILDETIHIRHTLNLESSIALNYAVSVSELSDYDSFYLQCTLPEFEGNVQIGTSTVEIQPILNGNYYYFPLTGLSAVRMNDEVQATVFMRKNGVSYCSAVDLYSIADYAYAMLKSTTVEDSLKILCADLLRYGSEAQSFKGYRTDAPVDAKMTAAHRSYLSNTSTLLFHTTDRLLGDVRSPAVTWIGKALSLDSTIGIKLVFDAKGYDAAQLTVKLRYQDYSGTEQTVLLTNPTVYNASEGYYAVTCYDLAAAELRTVITAAIYKGEQQLSESLQYSAESYAVKTDGTALETLCKALFAYSDSADSYFTK